MSYPRLTYERSPLSESPTSSSAGEDSEQEHGGSSTRYPEFREVEMREMNAPAGTMQRFHARDEVGRGEETTPGGRAVSPRSPAREAMRARGNSMKGMPVKHFSSVDFFSRLQDADSSDDSEDEEEEESRSQLDIERLLVEKSGSYARFSGSESQASINALSMDDTLPRKGRRAKKRCRSVARKCGRVLCGFRGSMLFLLLLIGMGTSLILLFMDYSIEYLYKGRRMLAFSFDSYIMQLVVWVCVPLFGAFMAGLAVQKLSKDAIGSGIPEIKSILSGVIVESFLTINTMLAKIFGLVFAVGGGLFVGKEGPAVHIASALAGNLMKLRLFRKIGKRHDLYMQVISAACAAGIAANFGSIVGGILFSAEEVTATYYLVTNFWKGMFAALTGAIMFFGIRGIISSQVTHLFSTNYGPIPYSFSELVLFALLGILCGLLGAGWNGFLRWLFKMKKKYKFLRDARYSTIMIMCIITGFITFLPGHFMRINPNETIDELLSSKPLRNYGQSLIFIPLIFSALVKFFFSAISFTLPMPAGLFSPNFLTGALVGRIFGELVNVVFPWLNVLPGGYAVVGAAGMASGVTRSLATAVIIFEITGEISHLLPVLIGVVCAIGVGSLFNLPVFEMILQIRGLPYLEEIQDPKNMDKVAVDVMREDLVYLTEHSSVDEVLEALRGRVMISYPIVNNHEEMILLGSVRRTQLEHEVAKFEKSITTVLEASGEHPEHFERADTSRPMSSRTVSDLSSHLRSVETQFGTLDTNPAITFVNYVVESKEAGDDDTEDDLTISSPIRRKRTRARIRNELTEVARSGTIFVDYDPSPFLFPAYTSMGKIHFLFNMVGMSHGYVVTHRGQLKGVITKKDLIARKL